MTPERFEIGQIQSGHVTPEEWLNACFDEIEKTEPDIRAWRYLDKEKAIEQARAIHSAERAQLALAGLPIGVKDIIDTADMPTRLGSMLFDNRYPEYDADIIRLLRNAGAVIVGKTVTTEFAYLQPSVTRNPHHLAHSPGGSSSGSAAAVAACHVPVALGSQTGGSVIRPASYCGVYGFKPSQNKFSRTGMLQTSQTLDHPGLFARRLCDISRLADVLSSSEPSLFYQSSVGDMKHAPHFICFHDLYPKDIKPFAQTLIMGFADQLSGHCTVTDMPAEFEQFQSVHSVIYMSEYASNIGPLIKGGEAQASTHTIKTVSEGQLVSDTELKQAYAKRDDAISMMSDIMGEDRFLMMPAATDEAPLFEDGTGNPACSKLTSLCGLPCVTIPALGGRMLVGPKGLPIGIQLVGAPGQDEGVLAAASWLELFFNT